MSGDLVALTGWGRFRDRASQLWGSGVGLGAPGQLSSRDPTNRYCSALFSVKPDPAGRAALLVMRDVRREFGEKQIFKPKKF